MAKKRRTLSVEATPRFLREYRKASATVRDGARREVALICRRAAQHDTWLHHYDTVAGLGRTLSGRFIELEIGGAVRLVAHSDGLNLTLVALGNHEIVSRLNRRVRAEMKQRVAPPAGFMPGTLEQLLAEAVQSSVLAVLGQPDPRAPLGPQVNPDWLHFLEDEQEGVFIGIAGEVEDALTRSGASVHLIEGGPGTGKTSVLLNLLDEFEEQGYSVALDMPDHLAEFIQQQTSRDLGPARARLDAADPPEITLVDDPASLEALRYDAGTAKRNLARLPAASVIVAFDPLQVEGGRDQELTDDSLGAIRESFGASRWLLRDCYRQKEGVGEAARTLTGVILESSPFLDHRKRARWAASRAQIAAAALDLRFINPAGELRVFESPVWEDWRRFLESVSGHSWSRLREGDPGAWPPLAVVCPMNAEVPPPPPIGSPPSIAFRMCCSTTATGSIGCAASSLTTWRSC